MPGEKVGVAQSPIQPKKQDNRVNSVCLCMCVRMCVCVCVGWGGWGGVGEGGLGGVGQTLKKEVGNIGGIGIPPLTMNLSENALII